MYFPLFLPYSYFSAIQLVIQCKPHLILIAKQYFSSILTKKRIKLLKHKFRQDINFYCCSYYRVRSCVHVKETYLTRNTVSKATVKINVLPKFVFQQFNSIFCEDGTKILFCDENEMRFAMNHKLNCRKITIG